MAHVLEFLSLEVQGTLGQLPSGSHSVYLMLAGDSAYIGRTKAARSSSTYGAPGIAPDGPSTYGSWNSTCWGLLQADEHDVAVGY